jgi:signal transduction histidine kinase
MRRKPPAKSGRAHAARSVTAVDKIEERLRHVQRLVMQGELAATAVHEISNLLTIVLFNAGLLRARHRDTPDESKYIEPLLHAATLIATLCSQLRNLARPTEAQLRVLDLAETAQGTFRLLDQIMTQELVFSAPADGAVLITADPAHIDQMLVNLVLNARDATREENGRISVCVGRRPRAGSFIEVRDNGTGITPAVKRRLFRKFFTTKPPGQGTGLGLVTVQRLMHGMGGTIRLTSRPGRGTCVRLEFPAADPTAESNPPAGPAGPTR